MGKVVSELVRQGLHQPPTRLKNRDGIPVLPKRSGVVVTNEFINRLRERFWKACVRAKAIGFGLMN